MKLFTINGWTVNLKLSTKRDLDFYDDFHISVSWRAEGRSLAHNILTRNKYIIFELLNRRLIEIKITKEKYYES